MSRRCRPAPAAAWLSLIDNDGFVDVLVADNGDPPMLLRNSGDANHFLNFKLAGVKSNRDAMGARIRVVANHVSQIREIAGGGSYLSQSDLRATFGLGRALKAESVEVEWPSGQVDTFADVDGDKFYVIEEGHRELRLQQIAGRVAEGKSRRVEPTSER